VLGSRFNTDLAIATEVHGFLKDMLQVDTDRVGDPVWLEEIGRIREKLQYCRNGNAPLKDIMGHVVETCTEVFPRTGIVLLSYRLKPVQVVLPEFSEKIRFVLEQHEGFGYELGRPNIAIIEANCCVKSASPHSKGYA